MATITAVARQILTVATLVSTTGKGLETSGPIIRTLSRKSHVEVVDLRHGFVDVEIHQGATSNVLHRRHGINCSALVVGLLEGRGSRKPCRHAAPLARPHRREESHHALLRARPCLPDNLRKKLNGLHMVQQVHGTGIMLGVDLMSDIPTDIERKVLLEYRVVLRASTNKHCYLLMPSFVMSEERFEQVAEEMWP